METEMTRPGILSLPHSVFLKQTDVLSGVIVPNFRVQFSGLDALTPTSCIGKK